MKRPKLKKKKKNKSRKPPPKIKLSTNWIRKLTKPKKTERTSPDK